MNENGQHDLQKEAMEWVNDGVNSWIREGLVLERIIDRGWFFYSIKFYVTKNKSRVLEKFSNDED